MTPGLRNLIFSILLNLTDLWCCEICTKAIQKEWPEEQGCCLYKPISLDRNWIFKGLFPQRCLQFGKPENCSRNLIFHPSPATKFCMELKGICQSFWGLIADLLLGRWSVLSMGFFFCLYFSSLSCFSVYVIF